MTKPVEVVVVTRKDGFLEVWSMAIMLVLLTGLIGGMTLMFGLPLLTSMLGLSVLHVGYWHAVGVVALARVTYQMAFGDSHPLASE